MTLTTEMFLKQKPHKQTHVVPRFTYLGAGAKNKSITSWLKLTEEVTRYVDVTAGSCNQPYAIGKLHQVPVIVNDASYYSYCIGAGLFHRKGVTDLNRFIEVLIEAEGKTKEGTFCDASEAFRIPVEVKSYIDGLISLIDERFEDADACYLKACIGRTILTLYTMRNLAFAVPQDRDVYKLPLTVENFVIPTYRCAVAKNTFYHPGQAVWSSAPAFLDWADLTNASVNFDPAWPFAKKVANPYHLYFRLGCILAQKPLTHFSFWQNDDPGAVTAEITSWVQGCLDKGAREVFVWNQTTNNPPREALTGAFNDSFNCEDMFEVKRGSTGHKYIFTDYVLRLRGK